MKKTAKELNKGDKINMAGKTFTVQNVELSEISKQGSKKCRLELISSEGEKLVIIRPEDYPFNVE